jgi:5-methylcytosine-specific restriction enzyme subunit McrC
MAEFLIKEQQSFQGEQKQSLKELNLDFVENEVKYLGLNPYNYSVSYYIGVDWLKDLHYILIQPKVEKLDYIKMFLHILRHPEISRYASSIYHFDFNQPKIKPDTQIEIDFNLFLIAHFLELCKKITEQGLKKNYIQVEENLNSKIKGKIIWSQQIKKNITGKREDRVFCRYQEYSVNCLENRLLKKTLLMVQRYLKHFDKEQTKPLIQQQNQILHAFEAISDDISYSQIKMLKVNSLYKEYLEAIDLAKKIMQKFGYSFANADNKEKQKEISPFWIDMSKLFELYVYSRLKELKLGKIDYQFSANWRYLDFLINGDKIKMVVDAKYKLYDTKNIDIEDIRQISGYARMEKVRKALEKNKDENIDCLVVYPCSNTENIADFFNAFQSNSDITSYKENAYTKFYKCGIKLPIKQQ